MPTDIVKQDQDATGIGILTVDQIIQQTQQITTLMRRGMTDGVHYGQIPGCGKKPALLQPGAQKLMLMFGLSDTYDIKREDMPNGHREYTVTCELISKANGIRQGSGTGLCSTMESRYRYRYKSGRRVENPDIADVYNTVLKMACKRALVSAVLNSLAVSDLFTQDVEDFDPDEQPQKQQPAKDNLAKLRKLMADAQDLGISPNALTKTIEDTLGRAISELNPYEVEKAEAMVREQINQAKAAVPMEDGLADEDIKF